jgi:hypothetical protein
MDRDALETMAAEAHATEAEQVEFETEDEGGAGSGFEGQQGPEMPPLGPVLATLFQTVGNVACARAGVSAISDQEAAEIGNAAANVAALYDVEVSPEVAAWLGLGMVAFSVVGPRLEEYSATIEGASDGSAEDA